MPSAGFLHQPGVLSFGRSLTGRSAAAVYTIILAGAAMTDEAEVYFEITIIGASAKVTAVDARTGVEVSVIAPAGASRADMQQLALAKLKARIAREQT